MRGAPFKTYGFLPVRPPQACIRSKIINKKLSPGEYVITWDGRDDLGRTTPAGIYFLSANDGHLLQTRKMVLIK